jgi:hypothetical protein
MGVAIYNLHLNAEKTKLLIRDPNKAEYPLHYQLAGYQIERVEMLKYLGTYLTSDVGRPLQIKVRKYTALGVYRNIHKHFQNLKVPFELLRLVYTTVILPIMTYGLNVMSLTKANRESLARKEALMVQGFADISHPRVKGQS